MGVETTGGRVNDEGGPVPRRRAPWLWIALIVGVLAVAAAAATWARVMGARSALQGAVITPPAPTYDFSLPDQRHQTISLGGLRGKAVVLTFLYANCPDVCPLIAARLHTAYQKLGGDADRIALVAVTVDPQGDTPAAVQKFLAAHHAERELHYLTGSVSQLRPIWAHYYIGTDARGVNPAAAAANGDSPDAVSHTAVVYLIDPQGKLRVMLPGNVEVQDLLTDLKILAAEAPK